MANGSYLARREIYQNIHVEKKEEPPLLPSDC